jgi:hypothetical protein
MGIESVAVANDTESVPPLPPPLPPIPSPPPPPPLPPSSEPLNVLVVDDDDDDDDDNIGDDDDVCLDTGVDDVGDVYGSGNLSSPSSSSPSLLSM